MSMYAEKYSKQFRDLQKNYRSKKQRFTTFGISQIQYFNFLLVNAKKKREKPSAFTLNPIDITK